MRKFAIKSIIIFVIFCALFILPFIKMYKTLINYNWKYENYAVYNKNASYQIKNNLKNIIIHYPVNYVGKPGCFYINTTIKTNNLGYRIRFSEDYYKYSTGGILGMGCSFLYGNEINQEETLLYKISNWLNIPSYNFAVGAYSLSSMILRLKDLEENGIFKILKPKVLLLGIGSWQYTRSISPFIPQSADDFPVTYPYIKKDWGKVKLSNDFNIFSLKYAFKIKEKYQTSKNENLFRLY